MKMKTKQVVLMGMFGALAAVLMLFEVPLPFIAPSFYGLDISEVPVLVGTFAMGPVAGAVSEDPGKAPSQTDFYRFCGRVC